MSLSGATESGIRFPIAEVDEWSPAEDMTELAESVEQASGAWQYETIADMTADAANRKPGTLAFNKADNRTYIRLVAGWELLTLVDKPVGTVFLTVTATNPGTYLGGVWAGFAQGRVLIGVGNNGENNYPTAKVSGGADSVTLTSGQSGQVAHTHSINHNHGAIVSSSAGNHNHTYGHTHPMPHTHTVPAHNHPMPHTHPETVHNHSVPAHNHPMPHTHSINHNHGSITSSSAGAHVHGGVKVNGASGQGISVSPNGQEVTDGNTASAGAHTHTTAIPNFTGTSGASSAADTGNSAALTTGNNTASNTGVSSAANTGNSTALNTGASSAANTGRESNENTASAGAHTHTTTIPNFTGTSGASNAANATQAHENRQAYMTCHIWQRTA